MVYRSESNLIVLSRFHWHIATIWKEPIIHEGKPSIHFAKFIHTPMKESHSYEYRYIEIMPSIPSTERIEFAILYLPIFDSILEKKRASFSRKINYYNRIVDGSVPPRYAFNLEDIKAAVVIGKMFLPDEVPDEIRVMLWG